MADYLAMYAVLYRRITAVIEELSDAQRQTEAMYIACEPSDIRLMESDKTENNKPIKK